MPTLSLSVTVTPENPDSMTLSLKRDKVEKNCGYLDGIEFANDNGCPSVLNYSELPAGSHTISFVGYDQAGNEVHSDDYKFTVDREVDRTQFGTGVSWKEGGSLLNDYATELLWTFENASNPGKEECMRQLNVQVDNKASGIGGTSIHGYLSDTSIDFESSKWTFEYWIKGQCYYGIELEGLVSGRSVIDYNSEHEWIIVRCLSDQNTSLAEIYDDIYRYDKDQLGWHHVAIVSTEIEVRMYINSILRVSRKNINVATKASLIQINHNISDSYIDEIRLSSIARSADEIYSYYQYAKDFIPED